MVINGYFPCDPRTQNFDDTELMTILADLKCAVRAAECPNVLLAGDLNCHFARGTRFTNIVENCLVEEMGLSILWQNPDDDPQHNIENVDYTHLQFNRNTPAYSTIDHFAASTQVIRSVAEAGVIHSGINPSNHSAIYAKLRLGDLDFSIESVPSETRTSWSNANEDAKSQYKKSLADKLNMINLQAEFLHCQDLHCKVHSDNI